jgi:hypothetical protein
MDILLSSYEIWEKNNFKSDISEEKKRIFLGKKICSKRKNPLKYI